MTNAEMQAATAGLASKSDRIRALINGGVSAREVAAFVGVTYQHVQNVLHRDRKKAERPAPPARGPDEFLGKYTVDEKGVVLPPSLAAHLGLKAGEDVYAFAQGDGLRLLGRQAALDQLKPLLRSRLPVGVAEMIEALLGKD